MWLRLQSRVSKLLLHENLRLFNRVKVPGCVTCRLVVLCKAVFADTAGIMDTGAEGVGEFCFRQTCGWGVRLRQSSSSASLIIMIIIMVMITNPSHFFFKGWPVAFDQRLLSWEKKLSNSLPAILSHVTLLPAISCHCHSNGSTLLLDLGCQGTSESAYSARTACTRRSIWITTHVFIIEE